MITMPKSYSPPQGGISAEDVYLDTSGLRAAVFEYSPTFGLICKLHFKTSESRLEIHGSAAITLRKALGCAPAEDFTQAKAA